MKQKCPKCRMMVEMQHNSRVFWCTCGRHWTQLEGLESRPQGTQIAIDIPIVEKPPEKPVRGRNRLPNSILSVESRADWLRRHGITEIDVLTELVDGVLQEYYLKDNYNQGTTEKVLLPGRFRRHRPRE